MTQLSGMARSVSPVARAPHSMVTRLSGMARSVSPMARGVDLNLDEFDLGMHTRIASESITGSWDAQSQAKDFYKGFWSSIKRETGPDFKDEDKSLLRNIFNPKLSDRRKEGDLFVPPETSFSYVQKLRNLVDEEAAVQKKRKDHFLGKAFEPGNAGSLFPSSWTSSLNISKSATQVQSSLLHECPEYKSQASSWENILKVTSPAFDKCSEDGARFRIYKVGSLEVRTIQEHGGDEEVGIVYSMLAPTQANAEEKSSCTVSEHERIIKATEYVESTALNESAPGKEVKVPPSRRRAYVLLETEEGNTILTEQLKNGTITWEVNPAGIELRNSLARVLHTADCRNSGAIVGDVRSYQNRESELSSGRVSYARRQRYAHGAYNNAVHGAKAAEQVWGSAWWYKSKSKQSTNPRPEEEHAESQPSGEWAANKNKVQALRAQLRKGKA